MYIIRSNKRNEKEEEREEESRGELERMNVEDRRETWEEKEQGED